MEEQKHSHYSSSSDSPSPESTHHESPQHEPTHQEAEDPEDEIENKEHGEHSLKTLLAWHAPGRPFKERGREFYINSFLILLFLEVILLLFREYLLMLVLASLVFLAYALSAVPPRAMFYKISSEGVMVEDHFYLWQELYDFYFKTQHGQEMVHIRTKWFVPGELVLVLGEVSKTHVREVLLPYLPYREYVKPSFTEKTGDWLSNTFPLEKR